MGNELYSKWIKGNLYQILGASKEKRCLLFCQGSILLAGEYANCFEYLLDIERRLNRYE